MRATLGGCQKKRVDLNHRHHASLLIRACLGTTMVEQWFPWASLGRRYGWRVMRVNKNNVKRWCQLHLMKSDGKSVEFSTLARCILKLCLGCADVPDLISA